MNREVHRELVGEWTPLPGRRRSARRRGIFCLSDSAVALVGPGRGWLMSRHVRRAGAEPGQLAQIPPQARRARWVYFGLKARGPVAPPYHRLQRRYARGRPPLSDSKAVEARGETNRTTASRPGRAAGCGAGRRRRRADSEAQRVQVGRPPRHASEPGPLVPAVAARLGPRPGP